ncbi:DUF1513 domain-containing protein [Agarivorans albus]|nr:DUF1513 domain-containing protein [Agarivorans albus]
MATKFNRRQVLFQLLGFGASASCLSLPTLAKGLSNEPDLSPQSLLIACAKQANKHYVAAMNIQGELRYQLALPARGHYVALAKPKQALAACVARRPGKYIMLFSPESGEVIQQLSPPQGMHFFGHAVFSEDATQLYVTAGLSASSEGQILVYHQQDSGWSLSEQWSLGGLGPHQLMLLPQQRLVVAVGGIHTQGREKLNLDSMQPALLYLDSRSGKVLQRRELNNPQLSIRHLSYSKASDTVWLACQGQNPEQEVTSLIYSHKGNQLCQALGADADYWALFNQYIGSIVSSNGKLIASSPRGAKLAVWSEQSRELEQLMQIDDVCGLAASQHSWFASTGQGQLIQPSNKLQRQQTAWQWDNHLSVLAL